MPPAIRLGALAVIAVKLTPLLFVVAFLLRGVSSAETCGEDDICDGAGLAFALLILVSIGFAVFAVPAGAHLLAAIRGSLLGVGVSGGVLLVFDATVALYGLVVTLDPQNAGRWTFAAAGLIVVGSVTQLAVTVGALYLHHRGHRGAAAAS